MIHVENLTRYFGEFCALEDLNFHVRKGEILDLLLQFS